MITKMLEQIHLLQQHCTCGTCNLCSGLETLRYQVWDLGTEVDRLSDESFQRRCEPDYSSEDYCSIEDSRELLKRHYQGKE